MNPNHIIVYIFSQFYEGIRGDFESILPLIFFPLGEAYEDAVM